MRNARISLAASTTVASACCALALATPAPAQSITTFGSGCAPRGTRLSGYGAAVPGGDVELHVQDASPVASHVLIAGASDRAFAGGALPWLVPPGLGFAPGCALRVSNDIVVPLPVDGDGRGALRIAIPAGHVGDVFFQLVGLDAGTATAPHYATAGVALRIASSAGANLSGTVLRRSDGSAVPSARVTLFTPGLARFVEARSDAAGAFRVDAPPGTYRFGVAARGFGYVEQELALAPGGASRDIALDPDAHPGAWRTIGDTLPHTLDATDLGVLLPDGRIFYCHDSEDPIVFDPANGTKTFPAGSGSEQGCAHTTLLEDGSVIVIGGQDGADPGSFRNASRLVKTWSPGGGWSRLPDLLNPTGRWYPGLARLADGDLLVMGGGTRPSAQRTATCERFDAATRTWQPTGAMGQAVEFPPAALLFTGEVLRTWGSPELWNPASGTWRATGAFVAPARGWPGHSDHSLLVLADGSALVIGVNTTTAGASAAMAERYDPATGTWSARSSPSLPRMQTELVALPDGRVLVQGGDKQSLPGGEPELYGIVRRCDLYDPRGDTWRRVADTPRFREYHAVTLLVKDGRVVTTGGTHIKFRNTPLSADVDAWSPPYLFRGVRPLLSNLSATTLRRGTSLSFDVAPATRLTEVVLLGTGATTHWVDGGVPRRLELPVVQTAARATVTLPADRNVLPVGHWLVFGLVDDIPSVAHIVRVVP